MSYSHSMPPNYQSLLYPNTNAQLPQQTILPQYLANGTGGNAADYMSKAVGGKGNTKKYSKSTIIRSNICRRCTTSKKCPIHRSGGRRKKNRKTRKNKKR